MEPNASVPVRAHVPYLHREVQAREELGHTAVSPWLAALFTGVFLGMIAAVPLLQPSPDEPFSEFAADRPLLDSMIRFEDRLEEESWVMEELLPPVQLFLTGVLGTGNEQVVPGRGGLDGWLFYRPAVDSLLGSEVRSDPHPALLDLHRQLAERGIRMIVLPVPVKAAIHPEKLTSRPVRPPIRNASWEGFVRFLEREGIAVIDLAPALPPFLAADTHWTPDGMEMAAKAVADWIRASVPLQGPETVWQREERQVEGVGDLARMLELPAGQRLFPPQRVTVRPVSGWRPDPSAEVLILGDSYTNVYSRSDLGWGTGAGLAEQLAFHLRRPVDRIAVNAGGAWASRQALARELAAGRDRLAGKRVVVVEFSARELSIGDWRRID
jgi:alginate O-acetyltransferase complex protein AlgJ